MRRNRSSSPQQPTKTLYPNIVKEQTTVTRLNPRPLLTIKGRWLEQLGFTPGQSVTITSEHGRLVIEMDILL
ncbi:type I toxin-antitoxin system SymE family toxin [Pragia fontium]|uniref:SymE family type I addiction module toxin n=1 Tax=Pragia fontium TaxID=82985 RepID=UPI00215D6742|nr:type I toxin-antitoxin system SymE family toxin [Pragia fontium]